MNARSGIAGATRDCPHCKATILQSAAICPACKHYLRFEEHAQVAESPRQVPLQIEGTIRHPENGRPWEYSVVLVIRDDRGNEIARKIVGVGAMHASEERSFCLSVEVAEVKDAKTRRH